MTITMFLDNYFENKISCQTLIECKQLIHKYPNNPIRIEIKTQSDQLRVLLKPSTDGGKTREIDGYTNLALMYRYFNNLTEDGLSQIIAHETYISHIKEN